MFSVITYIYNKKTKGPTLMELFTATGKLKKFFFWQLEMFDVCTTSDTAHIDMIFNLLQHTRQLTRVWLQLLSFLLSLYRFLSFPMSLSKYYYIFLFVVPQKIVSFILFSVTLSNVSFVKICKFGNYHNEIVCILLLYLPFRNQWIFATTITCLTTTHYSNSSVYELNYFFKKLLITRNRVKIKMNFPYFPTLQI